MAANPSTGVPRPIRFLLTGAANTLVGVTVIFALKAAFGANDYLANAVGYLSGLVVSFFGNSRWTFSFTGSAAGATVRFGALVALAYAANLCAFTVSVHFVGMNSYLAQLAGVGPYALLMYFGMKHFVFSAQAPSGRLTNE